MKTMDELKLDVMRIANAVIKDLDEKRYADDFPTLEKCFSDFEKEYNKICFDDYLKDPSLSKEFFEEMGKAEIMKTHEHISLLRRTA